jgi:hypothetical protein
VQQQNQHNKMALPEATFNDFFCIHGDLKQLIATQEYIDRIAIVN